MPTTRANQLIVKFELVSYSILPSLSINAAKMKKAIFYNLNDANYAIMQLDDLNEEDFEVIHPQLIPIILPENMVNDRLVNKLNKRFKRRPTLISMN